MNDIQEPVKASRARSRTHVLDEAVDGIENLRRDRPSLVLGESIKPF
jgi:hypothetical protein